ncbi:uncharacterized protein [Maniola hyperantus]|uniref:uncharacterized protein n=1 Tax=Aphantopus hyperantus TaxID=2795564 RepID=UPI00374A20D9
MKCAGCLKSAKEATSICCNSSACNRRFCNTCIDVNSLAPDRINKWMCPECSVQERKGQDHSSTPVRSSSDNQNITHRKKTGSTSDAVGVSTNSDVQCLLTEVRLLTQEISSLKNRLEEATISLNRCHERLDVFGASIASNESRINTLESRNSEIDTLKCKVSELQNEINIQAQNNIKNEIEICGIPECNNENTTHIALVLSNKIGVELKEQDIDWSARVGPRILSAVDSTGNARKHPRPIVVRLLRRIKRDEMLKGSKTRRNITSTDLNLSGPAQKVFVNERLTARNRHLFRQCRTQTKQMGYDFCWCSNGSIYVRQREGKAAIVIRSNEDLDRLINKNKSAPNDTTLL